jgi:hypothetical protein
MTFTLGTVTPRVPGFIWNTNRAGRVERQVGFNIFIVKRDVTPLTRGMVMTRRLRKSSYAARSATATRTK